MYNFVLLMKLSTFTNQVTKKLKQNLNTEEQ